MNRAAPAIAVLACAIVAPVLWSGWTADDAFYSALNGVLGADRLTLVQAMARSFNEWFFGNGRFYPGLILEKYLVFAVFTNLVAYKVLLVALTLGALELFRRFVTAYTNSACAAAAALAAASLFLVHGMGDALIAYNGMPQLVTAAIFGSLLAFRSALLQKSAALWLFSAALFLLAALTYEDVYLLCLLYPIAALSVRGSWRDALTASWPQFAIAVALGAFEIWLHAWVRLPAGALYALRFDSPAVFSTAFYQLAAPLPLVYWVAAPPQLIANPAVLVALIAGLFTVFAGAVAMCAVALRTCARAPERWPWALGALLAVLPALPVSVLVKYQQELRPGLGYLPEFLQTFGVALLLAGCARAASRRFGEGGTLVASAFIALCAAVALFGNIALVSAEQPSRNARALFERSLAGGLLSAVPDGATISIPKYFDWVVYDNSGPDGISTRGLLFANAGRRGDLQPPEDPRAGFALAYNARSKAWTIHSVPPAGAPVSACNGTTIANGGFNFGLRCWASVPAGSANVEAEGACFPPELAGKPFAVLNATPGSQSYLAQAFTVQALPARIALRTWSQGAVTVTVGIVYPVGTGIGTERALETFKPPAVAGSSGTCTGSRPLRKSYVITGFARGDRIQLRLHAAAATGSGGFAAFDGVSSSF